MELESIQANLEETFRDNRKKRIRDWATICIAIVASVLLYVVLRNATTIETNAIKGLSLLLFVAVMWFTEAVNISITAILIPVAAILMGIGYTDASGKEHIFNIKKTLENFADPTIYLFFGGFALATALHIQKIDAKIAGWVLRFAKGRLGVAVGAICLATALLSMWISNTATAAMMMPLAIGILGELDPKKERNTYVFTLLCVAYAASIGGLGTLVGSPPNAIAARALELDFAGWMKIGLPMMIILLPLMFVVLYLVFRPNLAHRTATNVEQIPWTRPRIATMIVFVCTAFAWIFSKKLSALFGVAISDALVALLATAAIIILHLASWDQISRGTDWGVLILFGGGLSLSAILKLSGASLVLGNAVAEAFGHYSPLVIIFAVCIFIIVLTEFTSNTASAALLVPVFATISTQIGMPKEILVTVIGIGASCAFMLPVATPPNAIVYGTGHISAKDMIKAGGWLNVGCIIIISLFTYFLFI